MTQLRSQTNLHLLLINQNPQQNMNVLYNTLTFPYLDLPSQKHTFFFIHTNWRIQIIYYEQTDTIPFMNMTGALLSPQGWTIQFNVCVYYAFLSCPSVMSAKKGNMNIIPSIWYCRFRRRQHVMACPYVNKKTFVIILYCRGWLV